MNRRSFLGAAGVATVVVAGGLVWRAQAQGVFSIGEGPAYEPWTAWLTDRSEGPIDLVRAGILAASPHNTQPWLFKLDTTRIELYADTRRNVGAFDPYLREMHIGLGCAVENMMLAAAAKGYEASAGMFAAPLDLVRGHQHPTLVASIALMPGKPHTTIPYDAIPHRRTNRAAYEMNKSISAALIEALARLGHDADGVKMFLYSSSKDRKTIGDILVNATETIIADPHMMRDSELWFRNGPGEIERSRDGLTLDCQGFPSLMTAVAKMMPPPGAAAAGKFWLGLTRDVHAVASPLFGLIAVRDRLEGAHSMKAGRLWQRVHLWATNQGLAAQPINQPLEVMDRERVLGMQPLQARILAELIGDPTWQPTFMFRMGYPTREVPPSPRRSVADVLMQGSTGAPPAERPTD